MANIDDKRKFVGTPNFVGPEIYMHEEYTENVDVFSLGVIMHFYSLECCLLMLLNLKLSES